MDLSVDAGVEGTTTIRERRRRPGTAEPPVTGSGR